jgi:tetratricopeptide (TPR) repeat protein
MTDIDPKSLVRNARAVLRSGGNDPHRRGMAHAARGNYREAMDAFRDAIAAVPDAPWSYMALAELLVETGDLVEANAEYQRALERTPTGAVAQRESIGRGFIRTGNLDEAIAVFRGVVAEDADRGSATAGLVRALLARSDELKVEAARLLVQTDDLSADEQLLDAAIDAGPQVPGLYRRLAEALARRDDWLRAITVIQIELARHPDDPEALAVLAELLARDEADGDALSDTAREGVMALIDRAITARPDDVVLLQRRAHLVMKYGTPMQAVDAWRAVVENDPDVALWHRELGDRLAAVGDFEAAGAAYDRAVALGYEVY